MEKSDDRQRSDSYRGVDGNEAIVAALTNFHVGDVLRVYIGHGAPPPKANAILFLD